MRIRLTSLLLVALAVVGLGAQGASNFQQLTVGATAVAITGTPFGFCRGTVENAAIRIRLDGPAATAAIGQPIAVGDEIVLRNPGDIARFSAIATTTTSGIVNLSCGTGTTPDASYIDRAHLAMPACNPLTRAAKLCP